MNESRELTRREIRLLTSSSRVRSFLVETRDFSVRISSIKISIEKEEISLQNISSGSRQLSRNTMIDGDRGIYEAEFTDLSDPPCYSRCICTADTRSECLADNDLRRGGDTVLEGIGDEEERRRTERLEESGEGNNLEAEEVSERRHASTE